MGIETSPGEPAAQSKRRRGWKVNWPKVANADRWLADRGPDPSAQEIVAQTTIGCIALAAVVQAPTPPADPHPPEAGPAHAINVFDVLVSRCAGHPDCPHATEVVEGIASATPSERELRAIWVYIRASTAHDVRRAWKSGEFTMTGLMEKIERCFGPEDIALMRALHEWMEQEHER